MSAADAVWGIDTVNGQADTVPYRLVATDLDGTLLREDDTVSARTRRALARATEAGAAHIVVTGRAVPWAKGILDALDYQGLAVCGQGSQVYDAGEYRLLTSVTLDRQLARTALEKLTAELGPLLVAAGRDGLRGDVVISPGYRIREDLPSLLAQTPEELWSQPVNKVYIQHPSLGDEELFTAASELLHGMVDVTLAGADTVELLPPGLDKSTGLSLAARRLGVSARDTVAFGDMPNDLPMFRWAGYGVAMANAHPTLRQAAHEITESNEADGVARVLERLFGTPAEVPAVER